MLPRRSERLLQDTNTVPATHVVPKGRSSTLFLIIGLFFILGLLGWFSRQRRPVEPTASRSSVSAIESTPRLATDTFVDSIIGSIVFYRDKSLVSLDIPSQMVRSVVGVDESRVSYLPQTIAPTWSPDGKLLAIVANDSSLVVSEYDTGRYKGTFPLPKRSLSDQILVAIDPANEVVSIATSSIVSPSQDTLRFYSLYTQKELGVYPQCSGRGVWLTGVGFATTCAVGDSSVVGLIRFEPNSSLLTPLVKETSLVRYQVIDENTPGVLLVKRTQGSKKDLVTFDSMGKIVSIPQSEYKSVPDVDMISNATKALGDRIAREAKTKPVLELSVAKDNSFLVFETEDGLYLARLDLKDPPYYIGTGTLPRIRPN